MGPFLSRLLLIMSSRRLSVSMTMALLVVLVGISVPTTYAAPASSDTDTSQAAFRKYWYLSGSNWVWGPNLTGPVQESFKEGTDGQRVVQYFSKGRMEQQYSSGNITSGLLVLEMISGKMQIGENEVAPMSCVVSSPIAGDLKTSAPTYEDLGLVIDRGECKRTTGSQCAQPMRVSLPVENEIFVENNVVYVRPNADLSANNILIGKYDVATGHNIPQAFVDSMRNMDWHSQIGLPISEPYWIRGAMVAGVSRQVMVQAFERRILTYTNYDGNWRVEMSNTGEHYLLCRYGQYLTPQLVPTTPPDHPAGWKKIQGKGASLWLPESYQGGDQWDVVNSLADTPYREMIKGLTSEQFVLWAVEPSGEGTSQYASSVVALKVMPGSDITIETILDELVKAFSSEQSGLPEGTRVLENRIVQLERGNAAMIMLGSTYFGASVKQVMYIIKNDSMVWFVVYSTKADHFDQQLPVFQQSIQTFTIEP